MFNVNASKRRGVLNYPGSSIRWGSFGFALLIFDRSFDMFSSAIEIFGPLIFIGDDVDFYFLFVVCDAVRPVLL